MAHHLSNLWRSIRKRLGWRNRSIRWQFLYVVNAVVGVGLLLFVWSDYQLGLSRHLAHTRAMLQEEAQLVLASIERLSGDDPQIVQQYLDAACERVRSSSSLGHHIAARIGTKRFDARPHDSAADSHSASRAVAATTPSDNHHAQGEPIVLGAAQSSGAEVVVSVDIANVLRESRRDLLWRAAQLLLLGVVATGIMDLMIIRLVVRPVQRFVNAVRRIGNRELNERVEGGNSAEFTYLAGEINAMSASLAQSEHERAAQFHKARRIQDKLQPTRLQVPGWDVHGYTRPAEHVGGDFFDYRLVGDGQLVVCVGDVAGHGIPAAIAAAMIKMLHGVAIAQSRDVAKILRIINDTFTTVSLDEDFATMLVGLIDLSSGRLTYASAGHETSYLLRHDGVAEPIASTGTPLGIEPDADWSVAELLMAPGDRLVLLTDGWPEAAGGDGQLFGRPAVRHALASSRRCPAENLPDALLVEIQAETGTDPTDDLTLVVIERHIARPSNPPVSTRLVRA